MSQPSALPCHPAPGAFVPVSRPFRAAARCLRIVALLLTAAVLGNSVAYAAEPAETIATPQMFQQQLTKRGLGRSVKIVRTDGSETKGHIVAIGAESVTIQANKSRTPITIAYSNVAAVKGPGLNTGAKVGIGIGVGLIVSAGIVALIVKHELDKPWNLSL